MSIIIKTKVFILLKTFKIVDIEFEIILEYIFLSSSDQAFPSN